MTSASEHPRRHAKRVTILIGESDQWHHQPLYTAILELLRRENCAGATVTRGIAGFGGHSRIHSAAILRLSLDLPVQIAWIDRPDESSSSQRSPSRS